MASVAQQYTTTTALSDNCKLDRVTDVPDL